MNGFCEDSVGLGNEKGLKELCGHVAICLLDKLVPRSLFIRVFC